MSLLQATNSEGDKGFATEGNANMGNFLPNQLVFAAKDDQMVSLLKAMAFNIASWERTLYGNDSIDERLDKCLMSSESAEAAYGLISGLIDSEFAFCFVPDIEGANGWLDEHRKDIEQLRKTNQTIESIVKYLSPTDGCLDNGFKFRDQGDSYDSETASVDMNRYGSTYVLRLDYCTRFVGNFESVDALISMTGLDSDPRADYGISHMCDCQMSWSGEGTLINLAVDDAMPLSELLEEASNNANMDLANEDNLQKIAWHVAECRWKETRWDDEEPLNAPKLFSIDAIDTGDSAIGEVDEFTEWAERILRLLPEVLPIEGTGYLGRAERVEKLNEGGRLVVAGDWNNDNFGSVCLEVFNDRGETLGNLSIGDDSEYASMLARVLPNLIASVEKMTPVSKRRKGSKYPLLDVRLELAPGITHDQFVTACKNNKDIDRSREVLFSSGTRLAAKDLVGNIDVPNIDEAERIWRLLPETISIEGTGYLGRAERVEKLTEGDHVVVAGDWHNDYFHPVCLEVFNDRGETLGNLSIGQHPIKYVISIAKSLPDVIATVKKVTPISQRSKGSRYPLMDVRLELAPGVSHEQFISDFDRHGDISTSSQVLISSGTSLTAKGLVGNVDVSRSD